MGPTADRVCLEGVAGGEASGVGETNVEVEAAGRSPGGTMVAGARGAANSRSVRGDARGVDGERPT